MDMPKIDDLQKQIETLQIINMNKLKMLIKKVALRQYLF